MIKLSISFAALDSPGAESPAALYSHQRPSGSLTPHGGSLSCCPSHHSLEGVDKTILSWQRAPPDMRSHGSSDSLMFRWLASRRC